MLNEALQLAASLGRCGIRLPPSHPSVKQPARAEALWVRLDEDGAIKSVAELSGERMAELWTVRQGKHNSFPLIKVREPIREVGEQHPLRKMLTAATADDIRARCEVLRRCLAEAPPCSTKDFDGLWKRLKKVRAVELIKATDPALPDLAAWQALLQRFTMSAMTGNQFLEDLAAKGLDACLGGRLAAIGLVETLIAGPARSRRRTSEVPLFFDVADAHNFRHSVADRKMADYVATALTAAETPSGWQGTCALSGQRGALEESLFPAPNLPSLGETYLFSMNKDVPCHTRYGLTGTRIFPVGQRLAAEIENALKWVTEEERDGATWRRVPGVRRDSPDLLLAYLDQLPTVDARLAAVFSPGQGSALSGATFEAACRGAIDALRGHPNVSGSSLVRLLVLRKVDEARRQIVLTRQLSADGLANAAVAWVERCCDNHPRIGAYLPTARGEKPMWATPPTLFPDEPVRLLARQWQRQGTESQDAPSCTLQEAFDLFLPPNGGCTATAAHILSVALQRAFPLLSALLRGETRGGGRHRGSIGKAPRIEGLKHVSLLSILLYRLDRPKEVYMNESAYKLGELLALADGLHSEYCRIQRKGSYPPQLVGNALLVAAAGNPVRTIARLAERLRVYQAWARTAEGDVALAKWILGRLGEVSRTLHEIGTPDRLDDAGRAELLLGYLAREKKTSKDQAKTDGVDIGGIDHD